MKIKEPESMAEIHRIRENLYEESRGLSDEERIKKTRAAANQLKKKYGLNLAVVTEKITAHKAA